MTLPELSIKRHVLAIMVNAVLVLFGVIAYQRIGMDRLPYVELPNVSVTTTLKGANPAVVDASVTNIIESAINSVPGIEHVQSTSSPGVSTINITFDLSKRIDVAFNEVQAKVNQVLRRLPEDTDPPVVSKAETNTQPILWLALQGDRTQQQLNQYALNVIKKRLETIDGVGEVRLGGRRDRTIRVNLDPARMAALNVTASDLRRAFAQEHVQLPGGFIVGSTTESLVKLDLEYHNLDEMRGLIVAQRESLPVRLSDIAEVEDGLSDNRQLARYSGKGTIGIGVAKVSNTNTVEIAENVLARVENEIIPALPPGFTLSVVSNDAIFILQLVATLKEHLIEGTLLASLVVWLFLRSVRSTLIIATAIPVSLFGAIAVMYFAGFTFNSITMLGLLLLIGVVVDDAIVVLENIYRHRETLDADPISAATNGAREVVFAILATTLSLVCIFTPVIFMSGIVGRFLNSFGVVVVAGVLVSWFVSLTLTPMLCSRYLKVAENEGFVYRKLHRGFERLDRTYRRLLDLALRHRGLVLLIAVAAFASSFYFFAKVGKTLAPDTDESRFNVTLRTPLGSSIQYTEGKIREIEAILDRFKEVHTEFSLIGLGSAGQVNQGYVVARMLPKTQRERSQKEVMGDVQKALGQLPGVRAFAAPQSFVGGGRGERLQFALVGPVLEELGKYATTLQQRLQNEPGIGRTDTDLQLSLPQIVLLPDRTRANALGISTEELAFAVNMLTGGTDIASYSDEPGDGQRYFVRLKAAEAQFTQPADLRKIYLRSKDGTLVRLDSVAQWKEAVGPAVVARLDLQYAANFFNNPTADLGEAVKTVRALAAEILPPGYKIQLIGQAEEFQKTLKYMGFAFGLALVLLYMVLASQFNSFLQPVIIMLAQPLAIVGGVMALWLTGQTLNIYSMIGLILLIGLVAKNSILLVDLTNQQRAEGMGVDDALRDACPIRMRPVLMTSFTIILALLPAALGIGAGAETNQTLSIAVIGGMITSTLLTLVVVPAAYSLIAQGYVPRRWRKNADLFPQK
ncbi:MAG: efflux RND transporter permease subunit [Betaproteobacteria bacterium]|nr:efflux RND transporter permease subunit [Betaproteobacteria bacterium]